MAPNATSKALAHLRACAKLRSELRTRRLARAHRLYIQRRLAARAAVATAQVPKGPFSAAVAEMVALFNAPLIAQTGQGVAAAPRATR